MLSTDPKNTTHPCTCMEPRAIHPVGSSADINQDELFIGKMMRNPLISGYPFFLGSQPTTKKCLGTALSWHHAQHLIRYFGARSCCIQWDVAGCGLKLRDPKNYERYCNDTVDGCKIQSTRVTMKVTTTTGAGFLPPQYYLNRCNNCLEIWPARKGMQLRTSILQQTAEFAKRVISMQATLG